jgi:DNA modification methylase
LSQVPVITIGGLRPAEKGALAVADNKIAEMAGWDRSLLSVELNQLATLLPELGLDLELTGFQAPEIDALFGDLVDPEQDPSDELPTIEKKATSRLGDLWRLGEHGLLCGDATNRQCFHSLMAETKAVMVFADPPYNVSIARVQGRGKIKHREFAKASGEVSSGEFTEFLTSWMRHVVFFSQDGSIHFVCMDWRHLPEAFAAGDVAFSELKNLVVWNKTNAGQGSLYRSQHELILVFKSGKGSHINNVELGKHGRNRSNVWTYAGVNTFRAGRMDELSAHPTVKPVALVADAMRDCSRRGDIVLDPFMGFGTTILAAERIGRRAYGLEIDPLYVDAAIRRWQAFTKSDAVLAGSQMTFDEVSAVRLSEKREKRA